MRDYAIEMIRRIALLLIAQLFFLCSAKAQTTYATISATLNYDGLQPGQQAVIAVVVDVKPGLHAQSHTPLDPNLVAFEVKLESNPAITLLPPAYPPGQVHDYPGLGRLSVYTGRSIVYVPLEVKSNAPPGEITLKGTASYQICDDRQCFAPEDTPFQITTQVVALNHPLQTVQPELFKDFDPTTFVKTDVKLFGLELNRDAYFLAFAGALIVGMIFNVMPCVLPIVPLKAMGFYQAAQEHRGRSLVLGIFFALGMIATFGALAILVVVQKKFAWGELFGNPYFAASIVVILVLMAMGTFGLFNFVLPTKVYEVTPKHDTYTGNFLFGILTAVLSTPCTFGMFVTLLLWASYQPPSLGTALVMTVGLGMAVPYLVLAAFPELARRVPRSGAWSEIVKQMMAFLLLATAVYFGSRFLPEALREYQYWWLVFAVIALACVFLIARTAQLMPRRRPVAVATIIGLVLLVVAFGVTLRLTYHPIKWQKFSQSVLDQALASGKPVIVKFTASWCGNCQYVEGTVYTDKRTVDAVKQKDLKMVKADLTDKNAPGWELLRSLHPVGAIPFTAVYLPGEPLPHKIAGIYTTDDLLKVLTTSSTRNPSKKTRAPDIPRRASRCRCWRESHRPCGNPSARP
jgi:thiol:disulfide interchange protein DsbD